MNKSNHTGNHIWSSRLAAARMAYNQGALIDAEKLTMQALLDAEKAQDSHYSIAITLNLLALICIATNRFEAAERHLNQAEQLASTNNNHAYLEVLGRILKNKANLQVEQEKYAVAESLFKQAKEYLEKGLPESAFELALCFTDMAWMLLLQRRFNEAMPLATEALATFSHCICPDDPPTERAKFIVEACTHSEDEDQLLSLFEDTAVKIQYQVGPKNPNLIQTMKMYSDYLKRTGKQELLEELKQHFSLA